MSSNQPQIDALNDPQANWGVDPYTSSLSEELRSAEIVLDEYHLVEAAVAGAVEAALYSRQRHERGLDDAMDLPVGAAVVDPRTGLVYLGYAQDQQLGIDTHHAEVAAIAHAREAGADLSGAVIGTTVEPCTTCLPAIEEAGITRAAYILPRQVLESLGILKPHPGAYAHDLVAAGRAEGKYLNFDLLQMPGNQLFQSQQSWEQIGLDLFENFKRDPASKEVIFDLQRPNGHSSRLHQFDEYIDAHNRTWSPDGQNPTYYQEAEIIRLALLHAVGQKDDLQ